MNKICLLLPFYGKWPSFLNLFLESCKYNDWIDFVFLTDLIPPDGAPRNVYYHKLSFKELNSLFREKLNFDFELANPYKLCDLRPAFGVVFEDYLKAYDFWGFGDIDLVFGEIRSFVNLKALQQYDVLCFRKEWCSGSFSIFRNCDSINLLFLREPRHKNIFKDPEFRGFDECGKLFLEVKNGLDLLDEQFVPPNFTTILLNAQRNGEVTIHFKTLIKESIRSGELLCWEKGKLYSVNSGKEYLLFHYVMEKKKYSFFFPQWLNVPIRFYIDDTGFFTEEEIRMKSLIRVNRKIKGMLRFGLDILPRVKRKYIRSISLSWV